jgi:hypothetical protein
MFDKINCMKAILIVKILFFCLFFFFGIIAPSFSQKSSVLFDCFYNVPIKHGRIIDSNGNKRITNFFGEYEATGLAYPIKISADGYSDIELLKIDDTVCLNLHVQEFDEVNVVFVDPWKLFKRRIKSAKQSYLQFDSLNARLTVQMRIVNGELNDTMSVLTRYRLVIHQNKGKLNTVGEIAENIYSRTTGYISTKDSADLMLIKIFSPKKSQLIDYAFLLDQKPFISKLKYNLERNINVLDTFNFSLKSMERFNFDKVKKFDSVQILFRDGTLNSWQFSENIFEPKNDSLNNIMLEKLFVSFGNNEINLPQICSYHFIWEANRLEQKTTLGMKNIEVLMLLEIDTPPETIGTLKSLENVDDELLGPVNKSSIWLPMKF